QHASDAGPGGGAHGGRGTAMQDWVGAALYDAAYWLCMTAMTLGFSLRLEGRRRIPATGPVLLLSNHQSWIDPVLVGVAVPHRHLTLLARKTLFANPMFARFIRTFNAVPVDQEGFAREGLRTVLERLQAGGVVLIFPEGERSWDGRMQP